MSTTSSQPEAGLSDSFAFLCDRDIINTIYDVLHAQDSRLTRATFDLEYRLNEELWLTRARELLQYNSYVRGQVLATLCKQSKSGTTVDALRRLIEVGA